MAMAFVKNGFAVKKEERYGMRGGYVQRFLFEGLDIRGALVRLEDCWQQMQQGRMYAGPVSRLLGEMAAVTVLMGSQMKQEGRLTFQLRGQGPIQRLVIDCNAQLQMRGMAMADTDVADVPVPALLGVDQGGQLVLSLDFPETRMPYQSIVPMQGNSLADIFEHYLEQSEQQSSRLFLAENGRAAGCLFLQKLPDADAKDPDGWARIMHLAATVKNEELLTLNPVDLLSRLFYEEIHNQGVRIYDPRAVHYHCPENRDKVAGMLLSLGRAEVDEMLNELGQVIVKDDICNREYRFSAAEISDLFAESSLAADKGAGLH